MPTTNLSLIGLGGRVKALCPYKILVTAWKESVIEASLLARSAQQSRSIVTLNIASKLNKRGGWFSTGTIVSMTFGKRENSFRKKVRTRGILGGKQPGVDTHIHY